MGSTIKDINKAQQHLIKLKDRLNKYAQCIDAYNEAVTKMMKGTGTQAYWEGQNAIKWYENSNAKLNKIIDNYANSYKSFKNYARLVDQSTAKNKYKIKYQEALEKFDGTDYVKGVAPNKDNKKITKLLPQVNANSSSDEYNAEAMKCFRSIMESYDALDKVFDIIITTWTNVAQNTKGDINAEVKKRKEYMVKHQKTIRNCKQDLFYDYAADGKFSIPKA